MTIKFIEEFQKVMTDRYIITRANGSKRVIMANDNNVNERAATFAAYDKTTVLSIQKIK